MISPTRENVLLENLNKNRKFTQYAPLRPAATGILELKATPLCLVLFFITADQEGVSQVVCVTTHFGSNN